MSARSSTTAVLVAGIYAAALWASKKAGDKHERYGISGPDEAVLAPARSHANGMHC